MREVYSKGKPFDATLYVYPCPKYGASMAAIEAGKKVWVKGIEHWEVYSGREARELEAIERIADKDDNHEYLVLAFQDGTRSTYRNSYVDMFSCRF